MLHPFVAVECLPNKKPRNRSRRIGPGLCRHLGFWHAPSAGLLARGSTAWPRLPTPLRYFFPRHSGILQPASPLTAAGPHRRHTGFPFQPIGLPLFGGGPRVTDGRLPMLSVPEVGQSAGIVKTGVGTSAILIMSRIGCSYAVRVAPCHDISRFGSCSRKTIFPNHHDRLVAAIRISHFSSLET